MSTLEWFHFWDQRAQKALGRYLALNVAVDDPARQYERAAVRGLLRGAVHVRGNAKRHLRFRKLRTA